MADYALDYREILGSKVQGEDSSGLVETEYARCRHRMGYLSQIVRVGSCVHLCV